MRFGLLHVHQLPRPWAPDAERRAVEQALEQIEAADRAGFDQIWAVERHFQEEASHSSAPAVLLAAAAARTSRIRLGIADLLLAPEARHPAFVAETVAALDVLSGGRVDVGTRESGPAVESAGLGLDRGAARQAWAEALRVVARMAAEEPFAGHDGRFVSMPERMVVPRPVQRPHPPLWLACTRRESIPLAAEHGLGVLCFALVEPEEAAERAAEYRAVLASDRCVPAGLAVHPRFAVVLPMHVHEDEQEAIDRGIDGAHFLGYAQAHYDVFGEHRPGRTDLWAEFQARREDVGFSRSAVTADGAPLGVRVLAGGCGAVRGAIGTPAQVGDLVDRYAAAGVDQLVLACQTGRTSHEHVLESLELFAREVLPRFAADAPVREAGRDAELAGPIAAALARRAEPPSGPSEVVAAEEEPHAVPQAPSPRRSGTVVAMRALTVVRAAAEDRGMRALRGYVARSDDRRLERTIGSPRGLRTLFGAMATRFDPVAAAGFTGHLRYELRAADGRTRTWTVDCRVDGAHAIAGPRPDAAVVVKTGIADFVRIAVGELDPGSALLSGRLDLEGDFAVATRLGEMFPRSAAA